MQSCIRTDADGFETSIVSLIDDLTVAAPLIEAGIPLVTMGMKPGIPNRAASFASPAICTTNVRQWFRHRSWFRTSSAASRRKSHRPPPWSGALIIQTTSRA